MGDFRNIDPLVDNVRRQAHLRAPFMRVGHKGCSPNGTGELAAWRRNMQAPETDFLHSRVGAQADKSPQFTIPYSAVPLLGKIGSVSL